MFTLLKQSKVDKSCFLGTNAISEATHFNKDGKPLPISQLEEQERLAEELQNTTEESPLLQPGDVVENKGKKKKPALDNNILDLPKLDFSTTHQEDQTELELHAVKAEESNVLQDTPIPKW